MKKLVFLVLFAVFSNAQMLNVNDDIGRFSLLNQFDQKIEINKEVQTLLVSFEKGTGADVNDFLSSKDKDFLQNHNALFIANISGMPSFITQMFALPKMRKYKHSILLIYEEEDNKFLKKDEKTTLYRLKDGVVESIEYIEKKDLEKVFN